MVKSEKTITDKALGYLDPHLTDFSLIVRCRVILPSLLHYNCSRLLYSIVQINLPPPTAPLLLRILLRIPTYVRGGGGGGVAGGLKKRKIGS